MICNGGTAVASALEDDGHREALISVGARARIETQRCREKPLRPRRFLRLVVLLGKAAAHAVQRWHALQACAALPAEAPHAARVDPLADGAEEAQCRICHLARGLRRFLRAPHGLAMPAVEDDELRPQDAHQCGHQHNGAHVGDGRAAQRDAGHATLQNARHAADADKRGDCGPAQEGREWVEREPSLLQRH